jgi:hypothetical protein
VNRRRKKKKKKKKKKEKNKKDNKSGRTKNENDLLFFTHHLFLLTYTRTQDFRPLGTISLIQCSVKPVSNGKKNAFEMLTPARQFMVSSKSSNDAQEWIRAIQMQIAGTLEEHFERSKHMAEDSVPAPTPAHNSMLPAAATPLEVTALPSHSSVGTRGSLHLHQSPALPQKSKGKHKKKDNNDR